MTASIDMTWMLDDLTVRVPEIERVVMLSRDGLAVSSSSSLSREEAERLAAIAAGFYSLARGSAASLGGEQTRHIIVEMNGAEEFVCCRIDDRDRIRGLGGCVDAVCGLGKTGHRTSGQECRNH